MSRLYRSLARRTRAGTLAAALRAPTDHAPGRAGAVLLQLAGVCRADPGEDGHRTAAVPLGGFLDRIAEAITRAGAAAG
jgi:hypothetical protein